MTSKYQGRVSRRQFVIGGVSLGAALAVGAACSGDGEDGSPAGINPTAGSSPTAATGTNSATPSADGGVRYAWQHPDETDRAVGGGHYRSTAPELSGGLDPYVSSNFTTRNVADNVYENFLGYQQGPGIDATQTIDIEGHLAKSFERPDVHTAVFKLRENVKWHNGRVMDIDDWRTSLDRYASVGGFKDFLNGIVDTVDFPDEETMVIRATEPYAPLFNLFANNALRFYVMPKEIADGEIDPVTQAMGTNHRRLDKYEPGIAYTYSKHPDHWREGKPYIDQWTDFVIPEYTNVYHQFVADNLDFFTPRATDVLQVREDVPSAVLFKRAPDTYCSQLYFGLRDLDSSPWRDERVRQALSMLIDREAINRQFFVDPKLEAAGIEQDIGWHSHIGRGRTSYWLDPQKDELGEASKYWHVNVEEAVRLIDAAGYEAGFDLTLNWNGGGNYGTVYPTQVQLTADMFAQSGRIRVSHNSPPYADWYANYYNDGQRRDFSGIGMWGNSLIGSEVDMELFETYHSKATNFFKGMPDSAVDDYVERQRAELDPDARVKIIHDFQKYMAEKMYTIPWLPRPGTFHMVSSRVHNVAWPSWGQWMES